MLSITSKVMTVEVHSVVTAIVIADNTLFLYPLSAYPANAEPDVVGSQCLPPEHRSKSIWSLWQKNGWSTRLDVLAVLLYDC